MGSGHPFRTCAMLLLVLCAVEAWSIRRAVVPAQDVVRFVAIAQAIEQDGLREVWRQDSGPPLFPTVVALVHRGMHRWGWQPADAWARSAQLAAAGALVLAIVPFYGLMVYWRGISEATIAAVLFCFLPELVRLGGDGLSDSLYLLLLLAAWLAAMWAYRRAGWDDAPKMGERTARRGDGAAAWMAIVFCGATLAAATLVHRQAWLAAVAMMGGLLVAGWLSAWNGRPRGTCRPVRRTRIEGLARAGVVGTAFLLGMALVWAACLAWLAPLTAEHALGRLAGRFDPDLWAVLNAEDGSTGAASPSGSFDRGHAANYQAIAPAANAPPGQEADREAKPAGVWLAGERERRGIHGAMDRAALPRVPAKETEITSRRTGYVAAVAELAGEMASASQYWIGGLALLGAWKIRRRGRRAIDRAMAVFFAIGGLGIVQHTAMNGYLSTRHVLPLAVLALGPAAGGIRLMGRWLVGRGTAAKQAARAGWGRGGFSACGRAASPASMAWLVVAVAAGACLPRIAQPLHARREAHRQVGDWLSQTERPRGHVLDSRGWSALYSGRTTYRMQAADDALDNEHLAYIVLEQSELRIGTHRARQLALLLKRCGPPVATFRHPSRPGRDDVLVFRWSPIAEPTVKGQPEWDRAIGPQRETGHGQRVAWARFTEKETRSPSRSARGQ